MMKVEFTKMSGAGNDFVVIDNRALVIKDGPAVARRICDRRWGVGADGLLLLEQSGKVDYRMMYYNADGSFGGMCGNGGRCVANFAYMRNVAKASHKFEALDFVYHATIKNGSVTLVMKDPRDLRLNFVLPLGNRKIKAHYVDTGSPHVVIPVRQLRRDLAAVDVVELGRKIRYHRKFGPMGTNVNFIYRAKDNSVLIRTYERGVENETLACGTGSIAAAIIAHQIWKLDSPISIIPASGVKLKVGFSHEIDHYSNIELTGPAVVVFSGSFDV